MPEPDEFDTAVREYKARKDDIKIQEYINNVLRKSLERDFFKVNEIRESEGLKIRGELTEPKAPSFEDLLEYIKSMVMEGANDDRIVIRCGKQQFYFYQTLMFSEGAPYQRGYDMRSLTLWGYPLEVDETIDDVIVEVR